MIRFFGILKFVVLFTFMKKNEKTHFFSGKIRQIQYILNSLVRVASCLPFSRYSDFPELRNYWEQFS